MMKAFITMGCLTIFLFKGKSQSIVYHKDLMQRIAENTADKQSWLLLYNNSLDSIQSHRKKVLANWSTIESVQKKIYKNLTNVDDGIKQSKQLYYIAQKVPKTFENILEAGRIAIGKPYLIVYWNGTGQLLIDKILSLQNFVSTFIMSHGNDSLLIDQITRDQLLWTTYNKINTIYNISNNLVYQFRQYTLQMAINKVVPYQWYINFDKSITQQILNNSKILVMIKAKLFLTGAMFLLFTYFLKAQTVLPVQDKANNGQLKRMVFNQWNDWQPTPNTNVAWSS